MASSISQRERSTILLASMKGLSMKTNSLFAALVRAAGVEVLNKGFANAGGLSGRAQANNSGPRT